MMNSGTITSMPDADADVSAIQPMNGSTSRPGMTHSDATEKPVARARGGIASERATKMPGPRIASERRDHAVDADRRPTMFGASAKTTRPSDMTMAIVARNRDQPLRSPMDQPS